MKFLDPDVSDICPDTCDLGNGSGKQQAVARIQYAPSIGGAVREMEITFNRADAEQLLSVIVQAEAMIAQ